MGKGINAFNLGERRRERLIKKEKSHKNIAWGQKKWWCFKYLGKNVKKPQNYFGILDQFCGFKKAKNSLHKLFFLHIFPSSNLINVTSPIIDLLLLLFLNNFWGSKAAKIEGGKSAAWGGKCGQIMWKMDVEGSDYWQ